jgi:hypothetical protein
LINPYLICFIKRENNQINKVRDEKGDITTNTNKIQRILREYLNIYIHISWKI